MGSDMEWDGATLGKDCIRLRGLVLAQSELLLDSFCSGQTKVRLSPNQDQTKAKRSSEAMPKKAPEKGIANGMVAGGQPSQNWFDHGKAIVRLLFGHASAASRSVVEGFPKPGRTIVEALSKDCRTAVEHQSNSSRRIVCLYIVSVLEGKETDKLLWS
ncbi:hypothetical protein ACFOET_03050 [Parapedobacter deserti]|uniref:Uncharacterized protein n=1 Tax=Parapedobacter deserti TaxID=1912957 RepID=A0ABV7JHK9_9SPHI